MTRMQGVQHPDCVDVREARARGEHLSPADAEHAANCPVCSDSGAVDLRTSGNPHSDEAALFASLQEALRRDDGVVGRLRSRPTTERLVLGIGWSTLIVLGIAVSMPRAARAPVPIEHVIIVVAVLATLLAMVLKLGLRPLQRTRPSSATLAVGLGAALAAPALCALLPSAFDIGIPEGVGALRAASRCFAVGALSGAALIAGLWALDRGEHRSRTVALLAAAAGGLVANAALELHCAVTAPSHLLLGHASVSLVLAAAYGALRRAPR